MVSGQGLVSFGSVSSTKRAHPTFLLFDFTSVKISNNALNFLLAQYRAIFKLYTSK